MSPAGIAETPAAPVERSSDFSVAAFRKGEIDAKGASTKHVVEAKATPPDETPDPEVEADPELRAAIDELEAPPETETPAEKGARTRKHKEAARRGYQTRLQNKATRLEQENNDLRQRLQTPPASEHRPADDAPRPAVPAETGQSDPEPTLESVTAKFPTDADPYARLQRELAAWDRRQERRATEHAQRTEQATARATEVRTRLERHAESGRGVYRDYDTKVAALGNRLRGHPADVILAEALADIEDAKVGGELLYRVASQGDALQTALRSPTALLVFLGSLTRDITAAAQPVKAEPVAPLVPKAPDPHTPVAGAAAAAPVNPFTRAGTEVSVRELREWTKTHGGRRS